MPHQEALWCLLIFSPPPQAFQNFWLSIWSEATAAAEAGGDAAAMRTHFYMLLYFAFGLSSLAFQVSVRRAKRQEEQQTPIIKQPLHRNGACCMVRR